MLNGMWELNAQSMLELYAPWVHELCVQHVAAPSDIICMSRLVQAVSTSADSPSHSATMGRGARRCVACDRAGHNASTCTSKAAQLIRSLREKVGLKRVGQKRKPEGRERATHRLGNTFAKQANKQDLFWRSRWCLRKRRWARLIEEHLWSTVPNVGQWSFECQDLDCRHLLLTLKMWPGSSRSYLQSLQNAQEWYVHYLNGVHHVLELNARYCQSHMLTFVRAICSFFFQSYMLSFPSSYMFFYTKTSFFCEKCPYREWSRSLSWLFSLYHEIK